MDALTLSRAYEIAHGMETAQRQASELQASTKVAITVNRVHWSNQRTPKTAETAPCYRCGKSNHAPEVCYYRHQKCHNCKKVGHIARMCKQAKFQRTDFVDDTKSGEDSTESPGEELPLMHIHTIQPKVHKKGALLVDINLDGKPLSMEVAGASVSLISEATWRKLSPNQRLKPSSVRLRTYTGQEIKILAQVDIPVEHRAQKVQLPLVVFEGRGPSLFERNWLEKI